jgi:SNF2 family DNA or RNA helicase
MTGYFREIPEYYEHQDETLKFIRGRLDAGKSSVFDTSDPGTGKTRPSIGAFVERRKAGGGKALVLAPKSILQPAWGNDISKFFPGTRYICAYATNRKKAFDMDVDIYITNHDAVTWLMGTHDEVQSNGKTKKVRNIPDSYWSEFDTIIIDESTAYKNQNAKRSKAVYNLAKKFDHRQLLTGTPNPNSVTEFWHQVKLLDDGESLGTSFWKFRSAVCEPVQVGPSTNHIQWKDKPGSEHAVYAMIDEMTIRHEFAKCRAAEAELFGAPYKVYYNLPLRASKQYADMLDVAVTMLNDGSILSAQQASTVHQKLMQMASGAVYKEDKTYSLLDSGRYELIMDLIDARKQCVVAFQWRHQREEMEKAAKKRGFTFASIDGSVNDTKRQEAVKGFQDGNIKVIFAHPQSAGHGLTLTAGTTTIWASPTYNSEHYIQFNARINRAGQANETETILVCAENTVDEKVYDRLDSKLSSMQLLLDLLGD